MKKLYYLLVVAITLGLLFPTVNAHSQSNPSKEWLEGLSTKSCNFTIQYEYVTMRGEIRTKLAVGYKVKVLPGWLMIYPCKGSRPKIIAIPSERVIQIEVN